MNSFKRVVNNERGAMAIIGVVVMSLAVVTTLSTVYVYLVNRAKYHARIKEAYQVTHVMEEFGKLIRQAYDTAQATPGANCPNTFPKTAATGAGAVQLCFPACPSPNPSGSGAACTTFGNPCIQHLNSTYCLQNGALVAANDYGGKSEMVAGFSIQKDGVSLKPINDGLYEKWIARLDTFFDSAESDISSKVENVASNTVGPMLATKIERPTVLGWIIREAHASDYAGQIGGVDSSVHQTSTPTPIPTTRPELVQATPTPAPSVAEATPTPAPLPEVTIDGNQLIAGETCPYTKGTKLDSYCGGSKTNSLVDGNTQQTYVNIPDECKESGGGESEHGTTTTVPPPLYCLNYCSTNASLPICKDNGIGMNATAQNAINNNGQACTSSNCAELTQPNVLRAACSDPKLRNEPECTIRMRVVIK